MQFPPLSVIESWPTPNYVDPTEVRGPALIIVTGIFFPIAIFFLALRMFTRIKLMKSFGIDDVFLLVAILPAGAIAILTSVAYLHWGWNRHVWDVPFPLLTRGLKLEMAMEVLFGIAVSCTKVSLLVLTRRVLSSGTGMLRHIAAASIFVTACEGIVFMIVVINTCSPVSEYWTLSITPQKCINERLHLLFAGIINTMTDFLVFFLPIPTLVSLNIPSRQQFMLCLLFGVGFIVCVAGAVRIYFAWIATSTYDRTWTSYGLWIASILELNLGIICTSVPACKPFFSRYLPYLLDSSHHSFTSFNISKGLGNSGVDPRFKGSSRRSGPFISQEPARTLYESVELQPPSPAKRSSRCISKQLFPLSRFDEEGTLDERKDERASTETSMSSFICESIKPRQTPGTEEIRAIPRQWDRGSKDSEEYRRAFLII